MLDLETLLAFYQGKMWDQPPVSTLPWRDICEATIAYLNGYKQARLILLDLGRGEAVESLEKAL